MLRLSDNVTESVAALRAHKLRTVLTLIGLMMGVATLIAVMTIVQGANVYVEQKIANLGTNVFQIARTPFAATDFDLVLKALRYKHIRKEDVTDLAERCRNCQLVGASASATAAVRRGETELQDVNLIGHTATMADIDTRTVSSGRYFTEVEDERSAFVCLIGSTVLEHFFPSSDPVGQLMRIGNNEFTIIGAFEKAGSVLGQDADNFVIVPLNTYLKIRNARFSLTINVKATQQAGAFERAMDEVRLIMRARRHIGPAQEEDFFVGTRDSYISLWQRISGAFFAVFLLVSSISAVVGGIVIMNVMLVSVTERTKEIGIRRAVGASQSDIRTQFLTESVMQCVVGGLIGIVGGFLCAVALRTFTSFPASVQTWVAVLGVVLSSAIGLFFGIYPAIRASRLDPVVALRAE
ncbi:MAG TPA: ABC transporter permease [Bryobacteraceae bacterium]|nr:ABC transporter permease [Bryobacteraceae bacterium]